MPLTFTSVSQAASAAFVKALVYGGPGMGKTVLAATLGPGTVLVSAESGILSLKKANLERLFGVGRPDICYDLPIIEVKTAQDFVDAQKWAQDSREARNFHTVAVDSLSEIAEQVLNNAKRQVKDPRQAYGELTERMETTVRAFRDLSNMNVYMTSKMEPMKDEMTGSVRFGPMMPGKRLGPAVPYFFDEVFRLGVNKTPQGEAYRFLQTQPDLQYDCKDRSGALASLEPPHLGAIFAKIQGA
jgi:hypothetical protein